MAKLIRCITSDGLVAVTAIDSTDMVTKAEQFHESSAVVTAALGRLLTAASLMGSQLKGENSSLTVQINGDGPVKNLVAVSDSKGNTRGYSGNNIVEIPLNNVGKLDVKGAVGKGSLYVSKDLGLKEPYNGAIELVSGEIAEDITAYYAISEQIPTVCALGVLVNPDLSVKAAGGYLIQLLPAAGEDTINDVEQSIEGIESITTMLSNGLDIEEIVKIALKKFDVEILESSEVAYLCNCNKQRVEKILIGLGKQELNRLADEQDHTEVLCNFCNSNYKYSSKEIEELAKKSK